jgi:hypothetical protein
MNLKHILLILNFSALIGCNNSEKEANQAAYLDIDIVKNLENAKQNRTFNEFFKVENVCKLESKENAFIASMGKMISLRDTLYILDKKYTGIKVFNNKGTYLHTIGKLGQGPGEFSVIFDMELDSKAKNLIVYSNDDRKMGVFTKRGEILKEYPIPFYASYFAIVDNQNFLFYVNYNSSEINQQNNLLLCNSDFNVKQVFFPYKRNFGISMSGFLSKTHSGVLYSDAFDDKVYEYVKGKMSLKYKFNFGKYLIDPKLTNDQFILMKNLLEYSYVSSIGVDTKSDLFFSYVHKKIPSIGFYDKKDHKVYCKLDFQKNDIFHLLSPFVSVIDDENLLIAYIDAETLRYTTRKNSNVLPVLSKNYPEVFRAVTEMKDSDNPIIITFKRN